MLVFEGLRFATPSWCPPCFVAAQRVKSLATEDKFGRVSNTTPPPIEITRESLGPDGRAKIR